jgi:hypothetical protein
MRFNAIQCVVAQRSEEFFRRRFDCPDEISGCVFLETLLTYGQVVFGSAAVSVTNSTETFFLLEIHDIDLCEKY